MSLINSREKANDRILCILCSHFCKKNKTTSPEGARKKSGRAHKLLTMLTMRSCVKVKKNVLYIDTVQIFTQGIH